MGFLANGKLSPVNAEKVWSIPTSVLDPDAWKHATSSLCLRGREGSWWMTLGGRQDILSPAGLPHHLTGLVGMSLPLQMWAWPDVPAAPLFSALRCALKA